MSICRFAEIRLRPSAVALVLSLTMVASCQNANEPIDEFGPAPIDVLAPLALTTTVSPTQLAPGDTVTMTVTITNVSKKTVTATTSACGSRFAITSTRDGAAVDWGHPACTLELGIKALAPGQSVSLIEHWDGMELVGGDAVARAPAGQYLVRANGFAGPVRTNAPAQLTVLPETAP